jgi:hypothetical protein
MMTAAKNFRLETQAQRALKNQPTRVRGAIIRVGCAASQVSDDRAEVL